MTACNEDGHHPEFEQEVLHNRWRLPACFQSNLASFSSAALVATPLVIVIECCEHHDDPVNSEARIAAQVSLEVVEVERKCVCRVFASGVTASRSTRLQ